MSEAGRWPDCELDILREYMFLPPRYISKWPKWCQDVYRQVSGRFLGEA